MSEKKIENFEAVGMKWSLIIEGYSDGSYLIVASSDDHQPYHHYYYELEWNEGHEPSDKDLETLLDRQVQWDAEDAWESSLERYYSV